MIYLFDKDERLIKVVRKTAIKTALQKYALATERYVSDRLTVEMKALNDDELERVEFMAIQTIEDTHTFHYFYVAQKYSEGNLTTLVGVQSGIEELRKTPVFDKRPQNVLASDVVSTLLAGTNWRARFVADTTPHTTNFYYVSVFDALKKVCEIWDLEMQFFVEMNGNGIGARYIDFKKKIGEAVGKRVVYGHNALQILQEVERTNIFTALVGRGKGVQVSSADIDQEADGYGRKITFEDVVWAKSAGKPVDKPKGQRYIELPTMTALYGIRNTDGTMKPKIGFVDFSEEENPEVLIDRTYQKLVEVARPQLSLKTSTVYLKGVKIGDTIRIVRHDKKLDYDTRIFEITFNRLNNQSSDIKLGDRVSGNDSVKVDTMSQTSTKDVVHSEIEKLISKLPDFLPSADGFNTNYYSTEDPTVKYEGKVLVNDIWYKPDPEHEGHTILLRWTGEAWEEVVRTYDVEGLKNRIESEFADVTRQMQESEQAQNAEISSALSKAGVASDLASEAKQISARATQSIANLSTQFQSTNSQLSQQAKDLFAQAQKQTDLTKRVETVETTANGTKTTVTELSKTVDGHTGQIGSVSRRTKTVEDELSGLTTRFENLSVTAMSTQQKLADYHQSATENYANLTQRLQTTDGKLTEAQTLINQTSQQLTTKANQSSLDTLTGRVSNAETKITQTADSLRQELIRFNGAITQFNRAEETVTSHTQTIGAVGSAGTILDNISKVTQTANLLQSEVLNAQTGLKTQVSQLAGSWAVRNLTSAGTVLNQINLLANGTNKIDGRLTHITGQTLIDSGVIKSAMIAKGQIGTAHIGTIDAAIANIINLNANNITAGSMTGNRIRGGLLSSLNGATQFDLNTGQLNLMQDTASIRRLSSRSASQFLRFEDNGLTTVPGKGIAAAKTILGSNYRGNEGTADGFAGIEIFSGHYENLSRLVGDRVEIRANQSGKGIDTGNWVFDFRNTNDSYFYPQKGNGNHRNMFLGHPQSRITTVYAMDYNLGNNAISIYEYLKSLGLCMRHILNGGFTQNVINAIRGERDRTLYKIGGGV